MLNPKTFIEMVPIESLILDTRLQSRVEINEETVRQYAEAMQNGEVFPPLRAIYVDGRHLVVDGWHRWHAAKQAGFLEFEAKVSNGTFEDAFLLAVGVNSKHGKQRTNADKRKAILMMVHDPDHGSSSDRFIAGYVNVSEHLVARVRAEISGETVSSVRNANSRISSDSMNSGESLVGQQPEAQSVEEIGRKIKDDQPVAQVLEVRNRELQHQNAELQEENKRLQQTVPDTTVGRKLSEALVTIQRLEVELSDSEGRVSNLVDEVERQATELAVVQAKSEKRRHRVVELRGILDENGIGYPGMDLPLEPGVVSVSYAPPASAARYNTEATPSRPAPAKSGEHKTFFKESSWAGKAAKAGKRGEQVSDDD